MTRTGSVFARALGWNIGGTAAGQIAGLALNIVLARALAPTALAAVLAGLSFAAIVSLACGIALDRVGIVAVTRDPEHRGALAGGIVVVAAGASGVAAVVAGIGALIGGDAFPWSGSGTAVALVALLTGADVLRTASGELPRAWLRTGTSVVLGNAGRSVVVLVGLAVVAATIGLDTAERALAVFVVGSGSLAIAAVVSVHRLADGQPADPRAGLRIARGGGVVAVGSVARAMIEQADVLVIAAAFDARAAAGYAITARVANAVAGATAAINLTVLPMFGRVQQRSEDGIQNLARAGATLASLVVVPSCLLLAIYAEPVLDLVFGDDIADAAPFLRILLVGQLLNVLTGVSGAVLLDAGRHRSLLTINVVASVAVLVGELAVLPFDDPRLVAWVNAIGFGLLNLAMLVTARRRLGIRCETHIAPRAALHSIRTAFRP